MLSNVGGEVAREDARDWRCGGFVARCCGVAVASFPEMVARRCRRFRRWLIVMSIAEVNRRMLAKIKNNVAK